MKELSKKLIDEAGGFLIKRRETIAVAESVTSGNVQALFSVAKNAISFFQGGITVYNLGQKCRHLLIEPIHALECNCVSKEISGQMALEVCKLFSADYGIGITGYASPVPEQNIKRLFTYIAIAKNNKVISAKKIFAPEGTNQKEVQLFYTGKAIDILIEVLKK